MIRRKKMPGVEKEIETGKTAFCRPCYLLRGEWLKKRGLSSAVFFSIALVVFAADQLSKVWVMRTFIPGETRVLIPRIFHLTYVQNPGAAFGLLAHRTTFFIVASLVMILFIIFSERLLDRRYSLCRLALALQLGGALGNLFDRLRTGYVVDFLDFRIWPVFNLADTAIVLGIILIFLNFLCRPELFFGSKR